MGLHFQTDRLLIREYTRDDLASRHALSVGAFNSTDTLDDTAQWLDWCVHNYRALARLYQPPYGDYAVVLPATGEVIGAVGLVPTLVPWGVFEAERHERVSPEFGLFWAMLPDHWGKGYALEAVKPLVDFLFTTLQANRIVATTEADNVNSQRVMAKLGMTMYRNPTPDPFWFQVMGVLTAKPY